MPSKREGPRPRGQADYKKKKRILLTENPFCHWCSAPASEADHLIEVDRGGDNSLENMVSSCRKCNAIRASQIRLEPLSSLLEGTFFFWKFGSLTHIR